jgi:methionyl-tRNA formyltransferase
MLPSSKEQPRLRVVIITEDDPLYVIRFFEVFFAQLPRHEFEIAAITISRAFHESLFKTARRMLRFYGLRDFLRLCWRYGWAKIKRNSIASLAKHYQVPLLVASSVNDAAYLQRLRELKPDVVVSVAAPEIFRSPLLELPRLGCVNIHSGRLPRYRGMMPNFWQMLHGERCATVSVHKMAAKLDAGDVIATIEIPLRDNDCLDRVIVETKRAGATLMIDVLRQLARGRAGGTPLDMSQAGYFKFPAPADVKAFRQRGHRLL